MFQNRLHINYVISLILLFCIYHSCGKAQAQTFDEYKRRVQSEFNQYKSDKEREFKAYRDRINSEFADYMRRTWSEYMLKPAMPVPDMPEPPEPIVKEPTTEPSNDPVPFDEVSLAPKPVEPPQPVVPLPEPNVPTKATFEFVYYGQKCKIPLENKHRFQLAGVSEGDFADGWMCLSSDEFLPVIAQCLDYRSKLHLCDWGYVRFVEQMAMAFFSSAQLNEARLMQMFILTQSGYKVRIARVGDKLVLLLPSKDSIYQYPYLSISGCNYYLVDSSFGQSSIKVFNREFPQEQYFSLRIPEQPILPVNRTTPRHLRLGRDSELAVDISVNKNLIEFYNDYPLNSHWDIYANASLSVLAKEQLYPVLRKAIAGKSNLVAANILLHFIQTAFEYETDDKQFGEERALFADETLFYPYSDCEDRAILYSVLVRDLLDLEVVLLYYPGHLATAVCFETDDVYGDHLQIDGKRYIVCDPTYINADVGQTMSQYKNIAATVVKLQ